MNEFKYISENLKRLEDDILRLCVKHGRNRDEVLLLPVSKTQDIDKIRYVYEQGYRTFGENRVQELTQKIPVLPDDIRWHLIGSLQSNKVKYIIGKTVLIHSVDRISLLEELNKRAHADDITTDCLLQVNISKEDTKSGIEINDVESFLSMASSFENIRIKGMMAIASFTGDKNVIKAEFETIQRKFVDISSKKMHNIDMKYLSMGMSGDYAEAIEFGSNIIRIGTTIFGPRS